MTALSADNPRLDVEIYNESNALFVSNTNVREKFEQSDDEPAVLLSAIEDRELIAVELDQDDGFITRVVFGDLSAKEKNEWVGRGSRGLKLPDGKLVVAGGASFVSEDLDDEFYEIIDVPAGEYFVTIFQHLPSVNGSRITRLAGWGGFLPYFRKTRPKNKRLPAWVAELAESEGEDLGDVGDDDSEELVAFVIQLLPASNRRKESPIEDDSFLATEQRLPAKCPLGIVPVGIEQPDVMSDAELAEFEAAEQAAQDLRFSDTADLAARFRPVADAIYATRYEEVVSCFVMTLRDRVGSYLAECIETRCEAAQESGEPLKLPAVKSVWRDGEPADTTLPRWSRLFEAGNNLYDATTVTPETYLGEIRCEFGDADAYIQGDIDLYLMVDFIVTDTGDGPQLAGVSVY